MWIELSDEEYDVICSVLEHCNLNGLNFLLRSKLHEVSPVNSKHNKPNAVKAAQTYFSASDLVIEEGASVKWTPEGDALVMGWQITPKAYIEEHDCGCGDK